LAHAAWGRGRLNRDRLLHKSVEQLSAVSRRPTVELKREFIENGINHRGDSVGTPELLAGIIRVCESSGLPVTVMPSLADLFRNGMHTGTGEFLARNSQTKLQEGGQVPT